MEKVYYIHGFGSSIDSPTFKKLKQSYPDAIALTYDHSEPVLSIEKMVSVVDKDSIIVGSSLGGWYAEQLSNIVGSKCVVYNPSIEPYRSLKAYGLSDTILDKYTCKTVSKDAPKYCVLSTDDAVLDYRKTEREFKSSHTIVYTDGGHRMTDKNMQIIKKIIKELYAK